jgi:GNAT superfamily N-acetyltransferase
MDAPLSLPEGLAVRHAATGDIDAITELIAACELDLDGAAEIDRGDIVMDLGRAGFDPSTDCVLVLDGDELVGWAEVYRARADADVRPSHRGRGIGAALLAWTEERVRTAGTPAIYQVVTTRTTRRPSCSAERLHEDPDRLGPADPVRRRPAAGSRAARGHRDPLVPARRR